MLTVCSWIIIMSFDSYRFEKLKGESTNITKKLFLQGNMDLNKTVKELLEEPCFLQVQNKTATKNVTVSSVGLD